MQMGLEHHVIHDNRQIDFPHSACLIGLHKFKKERGYHWSESSAQKVSILLIFCWFFREINEEIGSIAEESMADLSDIHLNRES